MPFKSEAQRRFLHARHPDVAERWEAHTPPGKLPERVKRDKLKEAAAEAADRGRALLTQGPRRANHRRKHRDHGRGEFYGFDAALRGDKVGTDLRQALRPPNEDSAFIDAFSRLLCPDPRAMEPEPFEARPREQMRPIFFGPSSSPGTGTHYEVPGGQVPSA